MTVTIHRLCVDGDIENELSIPPTVRWNIQKLAIPPTVFRLWLGLGSVSGV